MRIFCAILTPISHVFVGIRVEVNPKSKDVNGCFSLAGDYFIK
jgi:hypothetical protein